jgi:replicative DNA helicase
LPEVLIKFKIGLDDDGRGISYPYYEKGELVAIKYKKRTKNGEKRVLRWQLIDPATNKAKEGVTTKATLFGVDFLKGNDLVILVEGEDDAMMLWQLGYSNVVSIPNGSSALSGAWLDPLESFHDIVICFDNDPAGVKAASEIAESLGRYRCRIAHLPRGIKVPSGLWGTEEAEAKDITDFVRAGDERKIRDAIDNAPITNHEKVKHASDFIDELRDSFTDGERSPGKTTCFPTLDGLIGGRRDGELVIVSGNTGSGKSTWTLNMALKIAMLGEPVLVGSFELTISAVMKKFIQMISGKRFHLNPDGSGNSITNDEFEKACRILSDLPIYFVNVFGKLPTEEFIECMDYARRRLHVTTAILDHLHFTLRSEDPDRERYDIDQSMLALKDAVKDTNLTLFVVVHPSIKKGQDSDNPVINKNDLRGSSFIQQVADMILVVWRDRNIDKLAPGVGRVVIYCIKCRSECGTEGRIEMAFAMSGQDFVDKLATPIDSPVTEEDNDEYFFSEEDFEPVSNERQ